jgi:lysozyme
MQLTSIAGTALVVLCSVSSYAQGNAPFGDDWQPIINDASRAQLFAEHLVANAPASTEDDRAKALDGPFTFPKNVVDDKGKPRAPSVFGIDVSHWSSIDPDCRKPFDKKQDIDFTVLANQKVHFVYVKASQDVRYRDCRFGDYWNALGELHSVNAPLRGAYHFLTSTSSGKDQASSYIKLRQLNGGFDQKELPSVLDLEWDKTPDVPDRWVTKSADEILESALDWLKEVESASGRRPMVYTSNVWIKEHHITQQQLTKLLPYRIWIADYSKTRRAIEAPQQPQGLSWTLWQFSDSTRLTVGSAKSFDASIFKGTLDDFNAAMGTASR